MYGIIKRTTPLEFKVLGENGILYDASRASAELFFGVPSDSLVHFNASQVVENTAEVCSVLKPAVLNRERVKEVIARWEQEANIDNGEFVPIDAYDEIYAGRKTFVLGRKGVGKTAIAKQLLKTDGIVGGLYSFSDFPFSEIYKLRNEAFSATKYRQIWSILIITLALAELSKRNLLPKSFMSDTSPIGSMIQLLHKPLVKLAGEASSLYIGINAFNCIEPVLSLFKNTDSKSINKALNETQKNLIYEYSKLKDIPEVVVIFDQLDEEYRERNAELYPDLIESLFYAANWFRNPRESDGTLIPIKIKSVVLLREDIFDTQFNTNDKAKYLSAIVKPEWNIDKIKQVIHSRLSELVDDVLNFENLWLSFFEPFFMEKGKKTYSSFDCFIRFTSRTPRDVIELLKKICEELVQSNIGILRCNISLFERALHLYAQYYYIQVTDGARTQIPEIDKILKKIRDGIQSLTISRELFTTVLDPILFHGSPMEQKQIENENARIDKLIDQLINTDDPEIKKIINQRMNESKSTIANLTDDKVRRLLEVLWDVCAIGLLFNQQIYRAKYLQMESFSIKPKEQILFHPALGKALHLDVSVNGIPFQLEGEQFFSDEEQQQKGRFSQKRLNSEERELVESELREKTHLLKVTQTYPNHYFLSNSDFPNNVYCARSKVPPNLTLHKGEEYEVQVCSANNKDGLSFVVESFCDYPYPLYDQDSLANAVQREKLKAELSGIEYSMQVANISRDGFGFLTHKDFADNIYAAREFDFRGLQIGDIVDVNVGIRKTEKGFKFFAMRPTGLQIRTLARPQRRGNASK